MRKDDPHQGRLRSWETELCNPKSVDEVIRWCKLEIKDKILIGGWMNLEDRLKKMREMQHFDKGPFNLGRPYYLV